jgi:hypothetical protein
LSIVGSNFLFQQSLHRNHFLLTFLSCKPHGHCNLSLTLLLSAMLQVSSPCFLARFSRCPSFWHIVIIISIIIIIIFSVVNLLLSAAGYWLITHGFCWFWRAGANSGGQSHDSSYMLLHQRFCVHSA